MCGVWGVGFMGLGFYGPWSVRLKGPECRLLAQLEAGSPSSFLASGYDARGVGESRV